MAFLEGQMSRSGSGEKEKTSSAKNENMCTYFQISSANPCASRVRRARAQRKCSSKGARNCRIGERIPGTAVLKGGRGQVTGGRGDWRLGEIGG